MLKVVKRLIRNTIVKVGNVIYDLWYPYFETDKFWKRFVAFWLCSVVPVSIGLITSFILFGTKKPLGAFNSIMVYVYGSVVAVIGWTCIIFCAWAISDICIEVYNVLKNTITSAMKEETIESKWKNKK